MFTPRRFSELVYLDDGVVQWREAVSRRITSLVEVNFFANESSLAVGTNFGQLNLYAPNGELLWFRTVNRPITALATIELPNGPALAVGTATGSVIAFSGQGQRVWSNNLARDADRRILALLPAAKRTITGQAPLAAILESTSASNELADILLLGNNGQTLAKLNDTDLPSVTRLIDVNNDSHYELLLARFATIQLIGLGVGDSEYIQEWEYGLDAAPTAMLALDLDEDGEEEIIVGTSDGRLHNLGVDRTIRWLNAPGGEIALLAQVRHSLTEPPQIAVVRRQRSAADTTAEGGPTISWLELREATGELLWEITIPSRITALAVDDRIGANESSILVGTNDGLVFSYGLDGNPRWEFAANDLEGGIRQLIIFNQDERAPESILAVGQHSIIRLLPIGGMVTTTQFASFDEPIREVFTIPQSGGPELSVRLVVFADNGLVHGISRRGVEMAQFNWPFDLGGRPTIIKASSLGAEEAFQENATAFLVATDRGQLKQLTVTDNQPTEAWTLEHPGLVQAGAWDDLDKDGRPDTSLIGARDGNIRFYEQLQTRNPRLVLDLPLSSGVFDLSLLKRTSRQSPDLLAITQNGLIRLFREEENRPPLLTHPQVESDQGQFSFGIQVNDVENDAVSVQLEFRDPSTGTWIPDSEQQLPSGSGQLFWPAVNAPSDVPEVEYRFRFSDGFYRGYITPPSVAQIVSPEVGDGTISMLFASLGVIAAVGLALFIRQSQTPGAQAGHFQRQLGQERAKTLTLVEKRYASVSGSPDFLLQLANHARRAGDVNLANLADGLFLLGNRPQSGLAIIIRALDDVTSSGENWDNLQQRRTLYKTCQALLEAPSITELALLRPQFVHLLAVLEEKKEWSPILEALLPVLTNMRDSERVDSIDDRLVYLNQAAFRLRQVQDHLTEFAPSVEQTLAKAIARRWSGLLTAEIEEQRGRAELEVSLKTKRLAPNGQTHVAMEIRNTGRAAAENIVAMLDENPAYRVRTEPQIIPFLPSGRSRQVRFLIEPQAEERFRVGLSLTYDDRNRQDKKAAFGDMVHLLPPVREFTPIANPYLPGTPLRKDSPLFFGREELFDFIAEHAGAQSQRNVFMLVGQRRTGKTSLLLRLEDYLPPHLLPVYIDCQSLGVSPGMPALLQEFAWHIADALDARGIDCHVPELSAWQEDPTRLFQREFLPSVHRSLPEGATLLLVFDEFEAFESMVADGILPRTFFPYMRHLMQHSTGLGFVFVGTRRLEEMSADYWSVLFNIALYRKIDFLSPEATARLICEPVAPYIVFDDLAIDKIWRVTAGHPYFLQLVCYTLVKRANQQRTGYITISDVNVALDEMMRLGAVHFAYLWRRSNSAERAVLAAAAHLMDRNEPLHPEEFVDYVQSYGIELDPAEVTHALNTLVERDIMSEVTEEGKALYQLRIGLVGQWVAQNKSLSKLHVHLGG
jgi:outer membrane protein assembly factor BamB